MDVPLFGRDDELALLGRLHAAAAGGSGALAVLTGEPGVGKSALAEAAAARAAAHAAAPVLTGRGVADDGAPAFWPWLRLLAAGERAGVAGLHPGLLDLGAGGAQPAAQPAAAARFVAGQATVDALTAAARRTPGLVLLLEDLHWADAPSRSLLHALAAELADVPLLVLVTSRDPEAELAALPRAHAVAVAPLGEAAVAAYLRAVAPAVHPSWAGAAHRLTGGNPLYLRELARLPAQRAAFAAPAGEVTAPAQLHRLVAQRSAALGPGCAALLGGCAALGEEVHVPLLTAVAGECGPLLAEALAAGVLVDDPRAPATLRFSHDLVRQAAYAGLDRATRIDWHRRIADALDAAGAPPAERAAHRLRAAADEAGRRRAAEACARAADAAAAALDVAGAARWYGEALALTAPADRARRAELLVARAEAAYRDGRLDDAVVDCAEAMDLAEALESPALATEAALVVRGIGSTLTPHQAQLCARARALLGGEDSPRHARVLAQEAFLLAYRGDHAAAEPAGRRAMAMAERSGDPAALVAAWHARHEVVDPVDGVAEVGDLAGRMCGLAAASGRPDAELWGRSWLLDACLLTGDLPGYDTQTAALAVLAGRLGWPVARWHLLRARATRAALAGGFAEARQLAAEARDLAERAQIASGRWLYLAFAGGLALHTGEWEPPGTRAGLLPEALRHPIAAAQWGLYALHTGDAETAALAWQALRPEVGRLPRNARWWFTTIAAGELAVACGDLAGAARCRDLAGPHRGYFVNSTTNCHGAAARPLGAIASALGEHDRAVAELTAAVELELGAGAPAFAAHARLALASALVARGGGGDRERARGAAAEALRTARRLGMAPVEAAAGALHDELTGVRGGVAALTAREREIAGLLAAGGTNRAIAERLVLSERTVETHVRNLLAKLGLANRTQVAAWAAEAGLRTGSAGRH
ncbi:ATP-binding protein [Spirilliplanes yamanashiensis]|nr:LuxR family transcriptional regulator [Spirilliplanes yamanashiensis]MDP9818860.1 DNA-binding NarL/FixJ family response regulator [Spirilliplanes yamanashiensis]